MADKTLDQFDHTTDLAADTQVYVHRDGETASNRTDIELLVQAGATTTPAIGAVPKANVESQIPRAWIPIPSLIGDAASIPAATGNDGLLYYVTDPGEQQLRRSNGSSYDAILTLIAVPSAGLGSPAPIGALEADFVQGLTLVVNEELTPPRATLSIVDATTADPGVVILSTDGGTTAGRPVTADDKRVAWPRIVKDSDETVSGSDSPQADNHLTTDLAAGVYDFEILAFVDDISSGSSGGFQATIGGTFTASWLMAQATIAENDTPTLVAGQRWTAKGDAIVASGVAAVNLTLTISGSVSVSSLGSFNLSWSQASLAAGAGVKVLRGSKMRVWPKWP